MDYSLLIFIQTLLIAFINNTTPTNCRIPDSFSQDALEDGLSLNENTYLDSSKTLKSSESTEPDSSGDTEMTTSEDLMPDVTTADSLDTTNEPLKLTESVEAVVLTKSLDDNEELENGSEQRETNTSEKKAQEPGVESEDFTDKLFEKLSTEYSDDYNKSLKDGAEMDDKKEYTVKSLVNVDNILVLATPSGCSFLDFTGEDEGLQLVELKFKTSELEDCAKLTEDIVHEIKEQLAFDLASQKTPRTKMVEISVRDPMRNRQLNIKETTEVFTNSSSSSKLDDSSEFAGNSDSDLLVTDEDRNDAMELMARTVDFSFLPTDNEMVYVMSFSMKDQEYDSRREEMLSQLYDLFRAANKTLNESGKSEKTSSEFKTDRDFSNLDFEEMFKDLPNYSEEKLQKLLDDMKAFLETEEGKKALDEYYRNLSAKLKEAEKFYRQEVENGKNILDDLSKHGVENVQCSKLTKDDCGKYSKCEVLTVDGKDICFVSPKTIYWLLQTKCGLQSKSALLSIARDLNNIGIISTKHLNNLEQSFDLSKICNSITHSYLSKLSPKVNQQPNNAFN